MPVTTSMPRSAIAGKLTALGSSGALWRSLIATPLLTLGALGLLALSAAPALAAAPEKPVTEAAEEITGTTATLHGVLNPEAEATAGYYFTYGSAGSCEGTKTEPGAEATGKAIKVSTPLTGLIPHTKYTFCVVATNAVKEETEGSPLTFETLPVKPLIEGESVSAITWTKAFLSAVINPEFQETTCKAFQYVDEATFKSSEYSGAREAVCEPKELGSGSSGESATASLTSLTADTTYHYRVLAENASGPSDGPDQTFLTLPNPPTASTGEASSITPNSATISGSVNPGSVGPNSDTTYFFQYGVTTSYGAQTPTEDAGQGTSPITETASLTGREPDTTYHYRIVATNDNTHTPQTVFGEDKTFTTVPTRPILSAVSVSAITQSTATITATLDPRGLPTRYELELGSTPGLLQTQTFGNTAGAGVIPLALNVGSLSPGTLYYYRLTATNLNGPAEPSPEGAFTTAAAPAASTPPATPAFIPYTSIAELEASEQPKKTTTVPKPLTKAQKLATALKACKKKPKKQRTSCERQARKKYGPAKRAAARHGKGKSKKK